MDADTIRSFATATQRLAYEVETRGEVPALEVLEAVDVATRNPVLGFGVMCGLATRSGIDPTSVEGVGLTLAEVPLSDGGDLEPEEQGRYRVAYVQAANALDRALEPVSVRDAAEELGVSRGRVHQLVKAGKLERVPTDARSVNGRSEVYVRRGSLDALRRERSRAFVSDDGEDANER